MIFPSIPLHVFLGNTIILVFATLEFACCSQEGPKKERIIINSALFRDGVPLDYSYNETRLSPDQFVSVPGCPKSVDGYPWVLYGDKENPPRCYLVGQAARGCGTVIYRQYFHRDVMHLVVGSQYGFCGCDFNACAAAHTDPNNTLTVTNSTDGRYRICKLYPDDCDTWVYDTVENKCYYGYSRATCKAGDYLSLEKDGSVKCVPTKCGCCESKENKDTGEFACTCNYQASAAIGIPVIKECGDRSKFYSEAHGGCVKHFKSSGLIVG